MDGFIMRRAMVLDIVFANVGSSRADLRTAVVVCEGEKAEEKDLL